MAAIKNVGLACRLVTRPELCCCRGCRHRRNKPLPAATSDDNDAAASNWKMSRYYRTGEAASAAKAAAVTAKRRRRAAKTGVCARKRSGKHDHARGEHVKIGKMLTASDGSIHDDETSAENDDGKK